MKNDELSRCYFVFFQNDLLCIVLAYQNKAVLIAVNISVLLQSLIFSDIQYSAYIPLLHPSQGVSLHSCESSVLQSWRGVTRAT